jgi:methanogenic corrinoid protein MtbC1
MDPLNRNAKRPVEFLEPFMAALLSGDYAACKSVTFAALGAGAEPASIYQHLFRPALYEVGERWASNQISVAAEHLAAAIIEQLMGLLYEHFPTARLRNRKVVLATVEDELHRIGVRMVADVFEAKGWDTRLADSGCTTDRLIAYLEREQPDALGISCSVVFHLDRLTEMLRLLERRFPNLPMLIGGHAFVAMDDAESVSFAHLSVIENLDALSTWIDCFDEQHRP